VCTSTLWFGRSEVNVEYGSQISQSAAFAIKIDEINIQILEFIYILISSKLKGLSKLLNA
jgi:hypothetical protein